MKKYASKVLLFGEYTVINGSMALGIPFDGFYADWEWTNQISFQHELRKFLEFLTGNADNFNYLNLSQFEEDMNEGLYLECNIPIGKGMGSSGAICASVYDRYCNDKNISLSDTQGRLAGLENYFHGNSSGIDPLVSYYDTGILKLDSKTYEKHVIGDKFNRWYLIDSGVSRSTAALVGKYNQYLKGEGFQDDFVFPVKKLVDIGIRRFLKNKDVYKEVSKISKLQYEYLGGMIHTNVMPLWKQSLESDDFAMKVCGAGGGGMYLVCARKEIRWNELTDLKSIAL